MDFDNDLLKGPYFCLAEKPNMQSVLFGGKFINLSEIARRTDTTPSHLSLIFSRRRDPSLKKARQFARALGMGLEDFVEALER
jgi:transcriptional regulator with XRE-family HTH domain